MNTITIWLLVSLGTTYGSSGRPSVLIERFATKDDCVAVAVELNAVFKGGGNAPHYCVPAKVLKP